MADRTAIEWTDATWNPVRGCSRVSAGCEHCYAERVATRFSGAGQPYEGLIHPSTRGWNGKIKLVPDVLDQPLRWKRPRRIFVNSMSDLFHENVPDNFIAAVFGIMVAAPQHTFQVLTKRPQRALRWFRWMHDATEAKLHAYLKGAMGYHHPKRPGITLVTWPLPNVWLGVSIEDQVAANARITRLLQTPAAVRFLSCEPLLGPIRLQMASAIIDHEYPNESICFEWLKMLDWVIVGGESGPGARPFHTEWAKAIVDQCRVAGIACFVKQTGAHVIQGGERHIKHDKKGGDMSEWPHEIRVREFPQVYARSHRREQR